MTSHAAPTPAPVTEPVPTDLVTRRPRPQGAASPATASLAFAWRALLKIRHVPEQLADAIMIPIVFTLMFTYLFGGALAGSPGEYLQFLLPGTMVFAVLLITVYAGTNLNNDVTTGTLERFRTMPIWGPAHIVGNLISDAVRNLLAALLVVTLGLVMGFRPEAGVAGVVAATGLLLAFAFGISWIWATLGLVLRTAQAVSVLSFLVQFPLTFASNVFVDPDTMPGWLAQVVEANPVSLVVDTVRGLMAGTASPGQVGGVLIASAALVAVFGPLTMHVYRRRS